MDEDGPPHILDLEDFCRTCLTRKVRCTCEPMSSWSVDLIDITQLDPPNPDSTANNDRDDGQDNIQPSNWSDQDNFWVGKAYDKVRPLSSLKLIPTLPPSNGDEDRDWSKHLHPHNYRAKAPSQVTPPSLPQVGSKALGPTLTLLQWHHQGKQKTKVTSGYGLLKFLQSQKRPLKP